MVNVRRSSLPRPRIPPAARDRRMSCAWVNVSTETISGCAGRRERTTRSGLDRRNRTTCPAATSSGSSSVSCLVHRPKIAYPVYRGFSRIAGAPLRGHKEGNGGAATGPSPVDRGKTGSKHHLICDGGGIPLAVTLTGGNRNDITPAHPAARCNPTDPWPARAPSTQAAHRRGRPRLRPRQVPHLAAPTGDPAVDQPTRHQRQQPAGALGRRTDPRPASPVPASGRALGTPHRHPPRLPHPHHQHHLLATTPNINALGALTHVAVQVVVEVGVPHLDLRDHRLRRISATASQAWLARPRARQQHRRLRPGRTRRSATAARRFPRHSKDEHAGVLHGVR